MLVLDNVKFFLVVYRTRSIASPFHKEIQLPWSFGTSEFAGFLGCVVKAL